VATTATSGTTVQNSAPFSMRAVLVPLITIIIGIFMVVLDATAVNVALPKLVLDFHAPLNTVQWVVTGYALAQAAVIPLAGWLSDRFGAKPLFLISIALFTAGSVLCATAQGSNMLITFRVLQGLGGGFVLPVAMAYVYRISPPERVGAVMGLMGIPILFAPAIGPVLGGWLVQYASWRWIFLLNLPVGIVGLIIGYFGLPRVQRQAVAALDRFGAVLGPLAFAALSYGVSQGATSWTSNQTISGLIVGSLALIAFIAVELRTRNPLLELRVFRSIDFSFAIVVQWVGQFALFGALFLIPLFLQQVRGFGAFDTGLAMLPQAVAAAVMMPIGGLLFDRIGARPLVIVGLAMVAVATYLLAQVSVLTQAVDLILPLALTGSGMGLMMMALNTHIINAAPRELVSRVTSLTNALQQVINSLSVAGLSTILTTQITSHVASATAAAKTAHQGGPPPTPAALANLQHSLMALGFDDTFRVMVVAAVLGAVMGLLLRRKPAVLVMKESTTEPESSMELAG
jgi:EmrB/QacA subfamily drug resistance transporter